MVCLIRVLLLVLQTTSLPGRAKPPARTRSDPVGLNGCGAHCCVCLPQQLAGKAQLGGQGTFGARTADLPQIGGPGAVSQPQSTAPAAGAGAGAGASAGGSSSGGAGSRSSSSDAPRASPIRVSSVPRGQLQSGDGAGLVVSSHTISVGDDEDDENDPKYQLQEPSYPSARVRTISQSSVFAEDSGSVTRRVSAARARSVSGAGARLPIGSSSERKGSSDLNQPLLDG